MYISLYFTNFIVVYQPQPSTSGYGRSSPSDNFATSSTGNDNLHHLSTLTHDGQIIRIPQPLVTVSLDFKY